MSTLTDRALEAANKKLRVMMDDQNFSMDTFREASDKIDQLKAQKRNEDNAEKVKQYNK